MARPKSSKKQVPVESADALTSDVETTAAEVADINDFEIEALLAEINNETVDVVTSAAAEQQDEPSEPNAVEEVQVEDTDVEAALRRLAKDGDTTKSNSENSSEPATKTEKSTKAVRAKTREFTDVATIDPAVLKLNIDACSAKKVSEKVQNVIQAIESGKKLSRYTKDAVALLDSVGRVSGKSLVEEFRQKGLSDGTARAQAQQMTALFKMLGIAVTDPATKGELIIQDKALVRELLAA